MKEVLSIRNLNKTFESGFKLKDINFEILTGDRVGIVGKNGSGKSTLFKILI